MILVLKNFLCYTEKTFEFAEEGLSLISGPSGCGKTSILRAIFFVLFGEGNKVQHYGETSCSVEMTWGDMNIVRTKRPNRLVVNGIYEDSVGQEIINKKFGETFKTSGYIQQNNLVQCSVLGEIKCWICSKFQSCFVEESKPKVESNGSCRSEEFADCG